MRRRWSRPRFTPCRRRASADVARRSHTRSLPIARPSRTRRARSWSYWLESIYSRRLLEYCLRNESWPADLLARAMAEQEGRALVSIVVERLGDLFEPSLCRTYERLFTRVIERACPELIPRLRKN